METSGEKNWEEFAIMAWLLWNNRNYVRHEGSYKSGKSIAWEARKYETEVRESLPTAMLFQLPLGQRAGFLPSLVSTKLT